MKRRYRGVCADGRHSDLYIKQYDRKIIAAAPRIHKNPGAAVFLHFGIVISYDQPTYFCNVSITAPGFLVISVKYWQVSSASPAS